MVRPRWLPSLRNPADHRRQQPDQPTGATDPTAPEPHPALVPDGFWLSDPAFLARLHQATLTLLDLADDALNDGDLTLTQILNDAPHATDLIHLPPPYIALVQAEAAAQVVQTVGLIPAGTFDPVLHAGLAGIDRMTADNQQHLVRAAARRYAAAHPTGRPPKTPGSPPTPPQPPEASARRSR
ncbi:hypothetical protein ACWF94_04130 [Streptomyces sp. NPDC055078]